LIHFYKRLYYGEHPVLVDQDTEHVLDV